ncbi:hypothetical protein TREMEDRAFT_64285 [Tremella mesenterica DSM 1558]|uniref:uncharacterized protein n=1 Tax=Tremella mesenterica (strain ATCC 24925 / CBS 8224 / DSM 1558 / NBRC 9311 / NRRL Y-6157 / RJB 2259-6 / UBC 559-6) TaxID=578456 RepID=UPI0003F493AF|nr:uncharacterized protein TREMEDRAFT_64285 [Tremella mesenterica DSM 1558]EIW67691.1 hypothetical protein TREMEDRAFT_64285 [Tremella mesenterica DSM 1558]
MPPPIASSPLLSIKVIDAALSALPPPTAEERIRLLSTKLYILTNPLSNPTIPSHSSQPNSSRLSSSTKDTLSSSSSIDVLHESITPTTSDQHDNELENHKKRLEVLDLRLDLAHAHLNLRPQGWIAAESELSLVEGALRSLKRRTKRRLVVRKGEGDASHKTETLKGQGRANQEGREQLGKKRNAGDGGGDEVKNTGVVWKLDEKRECSR